MSCKPTYNGKRYESLKAIQRVVEKDNTAALTEMLMDKVEADMEAQKITFEQAQSIFVKAGLTEAAATEAVTEVAPAETKPAPAAAPAAQPAPVPGLDIKNVDDFDKLTEEQREQLKAAAKAQIDLLPDDHFFLTHLTQLPEDARSIMANGLNHKNNIAGTTNVSHSKEGLYNAIAAFIDGKVRHHKSANMVILAFPNSITEGRKPSADEVYNYMAEHHMETAHKTIPAKYNVGLFTNGALEIVGKKTEAAKPVEAKATEAAPKTKAPKAEVESVHQAAKDADVKIDTAEFKAMSERLTGEGHLDNMTSEQLVVMKKYLDIEKRKLSKETVFRNSDTYLTLGAQGRENKFKEINAKADAEIAALEKQAKPIRDDSKNKQGVSGQVGVGQKPVETKPDEGAGTQEAGRSGVVQEPSEEEEVVSEKEQQKIEDKVLAEDKTLTPDEVADIASIYVGSQENKFPLTIKEAIAFYKKQKGAKAVTPAAHAAMIKEKFRQVFRDKGNSDVQIDGAIALMDARAKSWASEVEGRTPAEWFRQIADIKNGEFVSGNISSDVKYQQALMASNAIFETRDGKPIGFNYDTEKVARERFDLSKLKVIGKGSDRTVFDLGNGQVLKIAHTARGLAQNIHEGDYYLKGIVPRVHERGLNYVVTDNIPRMKSSDMVPTYDVDGNETGESVRASEMIKDLGTLNVRDYENHTQRAQDVLYKYGLQDVLNYDVLAGDFEAIRNWGFKDGVPYHIDGGTFGGVQMILAHRGKAPLSDPEFREIYNKSKQLKKEYQDQDKFTKFQVEAFHGTSHDFEKFTTKKMGTGEGAQSFGWGLYFTDLEEIGREYGRSIAKQKTDFLYKGKRIFGEGKYQPSASESREFNIAAQIISDGGDTNEFQFGKAKERVREYLAENNETESIEALDKMKFEDFSREKPTAKLYKVSLHEGKTPDQYDWAEWDKPITSKQISKIAEQDEHVGQVLSRWSKDPTSGPASNTSNKFNTNEVYKYLTSYFGSPQEASEFLLKAGIDGIKFPAESLARGATSETARGFNYVVFDENAVTVKEKIQFQKPQQGEAKGALETLADGKVIIHALKSPDLSTMVHEIFHVFEKDLTEAERKQVEDYGGSEAFARAGERYLREGKAPVKEMQPLFEKFKQWLTDIYKTLKGSPIAKQITPEIRQIFDRLLTQQAKAAPAAPATTTTAAVKPKDGDKLSVIAKHTKGAIDYYFRDGAWHFVNSRGQFLKENPSSQERLNKLFAETNRPAATEAAPEIKIAPPAPTIETKAAAPAAEAPAAEETETPATEEKKPAPAVETTEAKNYPANWDAETVKAETEKLNPGESQGYGITRNRAQKESMLDFPEKAKLAFELRDFFLRMYGKDFAADFAKRPLSSLSQFFYTDVTSLKEWVGEQIKGLQMSIESNQKYIDGLGKSKSDQTSKAMWADTIEKSKADIEKLKSELEKYEQEKSAAAKPAPVTEAAQPAPAATEAKAEAPVAEETQPAAPVTEEKTEAPAPVTEAVPPALADEESTSKALKKLDEETLKDLTSIANPLGAINGTEYNKQQANDVIQFELDHLPKDIEDAKDDVRKEQLQKRLDYLQTKEGKEAEIKELFERLEKDEQRRLDEMPETIAFAYHQAKTGRKKTANPELVKAVEDILGKQQPTETKAAPAAEVKPAAPAAKVTPVSEKPISAIPTEKLSDIPVDEISWDDLLAEQSKTREGTPLSRSEGLAATEVENTANALDQVPAETLDNLRELSEPSAVVQSDGWPFVRLSDGSYTDGDQTFSSWAELKRVGEQEDLGLKPASKKKEAEVRSDETVKEMEDEIANREFKDKVEVWNYFNDEGLARLGYASPMEMTEDDRKIHAALIKKGVEQFEKESSLNLREAQKIVSEETDSKAIAKAYHEAKKDGSNPALVKAVEEVVPPAEDAGEKIKVFRGTGKNVAQGDNEAITWVAEDRRVAENYSSEGKVEEVEVTKPSNPFELPFHSVHVRGTDVANRLRTEMYNQLDDGKITREQALKIHESIKEFEEKAGNELEQYATKINKKESAAPFVKALKALGFDGIVMKESYNSASPFTNTKTGNETNTYGIFKEPAAEAPMRRAGANFGEGGFKTGRYNLQKFIADNQFGGSEAAQKLLTAIAKHPYFAGVSIYIVDQMPEGYKGEAYITANLIKALRNVDAETIAHEMMHFITAKIFEKPWDQLTTSEKLLRNGVIETIKKFDPDFKYLDSTLGKYGYPRSQYAQEVIAEAFLDSPFARAIAAKKISVTKQIELDKGLIGKVIDKIREFFGRQITKQYKTVEEQKSVVDALRDVFVAHGQISSARLTELNKPVPAPGRFESYKSVNPVDRERLKALNDKIREKVESDVKSGKLTREQGDAIYDQANISPKRAEAPPPKTPQPPSAGFTKDEHVLNDVFSREITAAEFPSLLADNPVKKQEAAKTQEAAEAAVGNDRIVDGTYVQAFNNDLAQLSLNISEELRQRLGDDWKEKAIAFMESPKFKYTGNPAIKAGVLNVLSADVFKEIADTTNPQKLAELQDRQRRLDKIALRVAREGSTVLRQRMLYAAFARAIPVKQLLQQTVLSKEQQEAILLAQEADNFDVTAEELDAIPDEDPPQTETEKKEKKKRRRKTAAEKEEAAEKSKTKKKNVDLHNDLKTRGASAAERFNEAGQKEKKSFKDIIREMKDRLDKLDC